MVPSVVLRASLVLMGLLAPALAAPAASTVMTPFGERSSEHVHLIPEGSSELSHTSFRT